MLWFDMRFMLPPRKGERLAVDLRAMSGGRMPGLEGPMEALPPPPAVDEDHLEASLPPDTPGGGRRSRGSGFPLRERFDWWPEAEGSSASGLKYDLTACMAFE
jgi:hypothetical protein